MTRIIAGQTLVVPIRGRVGDLDSIYTLNEIGSRIWHLIDGHTPMNEIIQTITTEYDVTEEEAARDVLDLVNSMQEAGLIHSGVESRTE